MPKSQFNKRQYYTWALDDKQIAAFEAWRDEIWRTDKRSPGAIGGTFTFHITGTTIGTTGTNASTSIPSNGRDGTIIKASYREGEKEIDLTDYDSW
jgi:hypothetical protein